MARDIKFRAWDKVSGKLFRVEGLNFDRQGLQTVYSAEDFGALVDGQNSGDYRRRDDEVELMQYTGLKDKNGMEIYEGDVIRNPDGTGPVVWFTDGWTIEGLSDRTFSMRQALLWHGTPELEVIGNIYENPELIQK